MISIVLFCTGCGIGTGCISFLVYKLIIRRREGQRFQRFIDAYEYDEENIVL